MDQSGPGDNNRVTIVLREATEIMKEGHTGFVGHCKGFASCSGMHLEGWRRAMRDMTNLKGAQWLLYCVQISWDGKNGGNRLSSFIAEIQVRVLWAKVGMIAGEEMSWILNKFLIYHSILLLK